MTAKIIDGVAIARQIRSDIRRRVETLVSQYATKPGLAVILVGANAASEVYVRNKVRACGEVGIHSEVMRFESDVAEERLLDCVRRLNDDPAIHGILVQLPLPPTISVQRVLTTTRSTRMSTASISTMSAASSSATPCSRRARLTAFEAPRIREHPGRRPQRHRGRRQQCRRQADGADADGARGDGRDLSRQDARASQYTILADILVVAAGHPKLIVPQMVRNGAVVIDVGINRLPDGKLVGDVDFEGVREKASHITPVPGGVGPMTVTMLLDNTVASAERSVGIRSQAR